MTTDRKIAAKLARDFYSGIINFKQFCLYYPDKTGDDEIDELFYLIEHEPKAGGPLGVDNSRHQLYIEEINRFIYKLENDEGFPVDSFVNWFNLNDFVFERKLVYSTGFDLMVKTFEVKTNDVKINELLVNNYFGDFYYLTINGIFLRKFKTKKSWPKTRLVYLDLFGNRLIEKLKTGSSYLDWTIKPIDNLTFEIDTKKEKIKVNVP